MVKRPIRADLPAFLRHHPVGGDRRRPAVGIEQHLAAAGIEHGIAVERLQLAGRVHLHAPVARESLAPPASARRQPGVALDRDIERIVGLGRPRPVPGKCSPCRSRRTPSAVRRFSTARSRMRRPGRGTRRYSCWRCCWQPSRAASARRSRPTSRHRDWSASGAAQLQALQAEQQVARKAGRGRGTSEDLRQRGGFRRAVVAG